MTVDNKIFFAAAEAQLASGNKVRITLVGSSMQPTLCEGDVLTLAPPERDPKVGDIVLFRYRGLHLLHRIVAVEGDSYIIRGDNSAGTECCRREDIVGILVNVEKHNKLKHFVVRWFGRQGRRQLRPWYFAGLAFLMWAPLNGIGIPLDNYILGLRFDHLVHASVFIPCALFLWDMPVTKGKAWLVWACAVAVGMLTESVQWLLPFRGFDINDMVANFLGSSLGWLAIILFRQGARRRRQYPAREKRG